ncbi:MAG TPA: hypothetical protein PLD20_12955 [Blastocatellia bacterium]|nr:hypothetical protein [Blastocatellia bacterium]HMX28612.1 hypothetical protein [Blastocatellia bacterium]HMY70280.1 hypothetical protein [Blastocatellia bacterium]HMZ18837.1 hypothetical protein [Blastocatellia bacterium]HNG31839.1 hypothetical protein [Blastocatellia bacterium]
MSVWDYLAPSITGRLTSLQLGMQRIEEHLAELFNQVTAQGEKLMSNILELKELAVTAFAENTESLNLAIAKIEELKSKLPSDEDAAAIEEITASLRRQIEANDEFQAKLSPPAEE